MEKEDQKGISKKRYYNHYVSVVVDGQLTGWTGRNPERFPEDKQKALDIAAHYKLSGRTAYAVEVKEILPCPSKTA